VRLGQLLDRNKYPAVEGPLVAVLAATTSIVGFELVPLYSPAGVVLVWYVVAAAQYSLLKSPQSDPGSALLGERGLAFARAVHFIMLGSLAIGADAVVQQETIYAQNSTPALYGRLLDQDAIVLVLRDFLLYSVLALPFIWLFGQLPTWLRAMFHHILEQCDVLVFGGGGSVNVMGALWRLFSSILVLAICSGVCYAALDLDSDHRGTRSGLFAVFCGLVTATSFLLSRLPSDVAVLVGALRQWSCCVPDEKDGDGEVIKTVGSEMIHRKRTLFSRRLSWDGCFSVLLGLTATVLHLVGFFTISNPKFETVVQILTVTVGCSVHYIIPELRQQYPWQAFRRPIMKEPTTQGHEHRVSVVSRWGKLAEAYVLWPTVILTAAATNGAAMVDRFGRGPTAVILSLFALTSMRKGFSGHILLWSSLLVAVLFFTYDLGGVTEGLPMDMLLTMLIVTKLRGLWLRLGFAFTYVVPWNTKDIQEASTVIVYPLQFPYGARFRQKFTLEDAIGSHACSLEATTRVTNGIPLGSSLLLPVCTVNCVQTLKAQCDDCLSVGGGHTCNGSDLSSDG
jgi:hypothetical protein